MNKFDNFFYSVVQFVQKTDPEAVIIGCANAEIEAIEIEFSVSFPKELKSYLKYFGQRMSFYGSNHIPEALSLQKIYSTLQLDSKSNNFEIVKNWCERKKLGFLPVWYLTENDILIFLAYNNNMYRWFITDDPTDQKSIVPSGYIIDEFRRTIKSKVIFCIKSRDYLFDFSNIYWLQIYMLTDTIFFTSNTFYNLNKEEEDSSGKIHGFEEYEIEQLKYYLEENMLPIDKETTVKMLDYFNYSN